MWTDSKTQIWFNGSKLKKKNVLESAHDRPPFYDFCIIIVEFKSFLPCLRVWNQHRAFAKLFSTSLFIIYGYQLRSIFSSCCQTIAQ